MLSLEMSQSCIYLSGAKKKASAFMLPAVPERHATMTGMQDFETLAGNRVPDVFCEIWVSQKSHTGLKMEITLRTFDDMH
jgi:hypothetical protein